MYTLSHASRSYQRRSGSYPYCGIVGAYGAYDAEGNKVYDDLVRKMKIAVVFYGSPFYYCYVGYDSNNPLI
jgi:Cu2+-exporting ATPase